VVEPGRALCINPELAAKRFVSTQATATVLLWNSSVIHNPLRWRTVQYATESIAPVGWPRRPPGQEVTRKSASLRVNLDRLQPAPGVFKRGARTEYWPETLLQPGRTSPERVVQATG